MDAKIHYISCRPALTPLHNYKNKKACIHRMQVLIFTPYQAYFVCFGVHKLITNIFKSYAFAQLILDASFKTFDLGINIFYQKEI